MESGFFLHHRIFNNFYDSLTALGIYVTNKFITFNEQQIVLDLVTHGQKAGLFPGIRGEMCDFDRHLVRAT